MEQKDISQKTKLVVEEGKKRNSSLHLPIHKRRIQNELQMKAFDCKRKKPWYFESTNFYANLTPSEREELIKISKLKRFKKGQYLYHVDEPSEEVFLIKSGRVKSFLTSPDGKEILLYVRYPGDIVAVTALCGIYHRTTYAKALEDTVVWTINIENCYNFLIARPHLMILIMKIIASRHYQSKMLIQDLSIHSAWKRLANFLLRTALERGEVLENGSIRFRMDLTQEHIAQIIGTCRQTINRLMKSLRKEKIFRQEGHTIIVQGKKLKSFLES